MRTVAPTDAEVAALRAFNRTYTRRLGLMHERLDDSAFALTEARVLYELAHRCWPTAAEIGRELDLDRAQLSRILKRFRLDGLVRGKVSETHAKRRLLELTDLGQKAFKTLDGATQSAVGALLGKLSSGDRRRLLHAADAVARVLDQPEQTELTFALRAPGPGDLGWVIHRQAVLYSEEYGWDWSYEALAAEILAAFVKTFDPAREHAWIAEVDGAIAGSIFLMRSPDMASAKLRLLYVEATARGRGVGQTLVDTCIERAREIGYERLELWTNSVLVSARRLYEAAGFQLIEETPHRSFGQDLIGQIWSLDLRDRAASVTSRERRASSWGGCRTEP